MISDEKINFNQIANQINIKSKELLGLLETSKAGIQILRETWNPKTKKAIIRVNNKYVHKLKSCFLFINNIDGKDAVIQSIGLSGNISKIKKKIAI